MEDKVEEKKKITTERSINKYCFVLLSHTSVSGVKKTVDINLGLKVYLRDLNLVLIYSAEFSFSANQNSFGFLHKQHSFLAMGYKI